MDWFRKAIEPSAKSIVRPNTASSRPALRAGDSGEAGLHRFGWVTESAQPRAGG